MKHLLTITLLAVAMLSLGACKHRKQAAPTAPAAPVSYAK